MFSNYPLSKPQNSPPLMCGVICPIVSCSRKCSLHWKYYGCVEWSQRKVFTRGQSSCCKFVPRHFQFQTRSFKSFWVLNWDVSYVGRTWSIHTNVAVYMFKCLCLCNYAQHNIVQEWRQNHIIFCGIEWTISKC